MFGSADYQTRTEIVFRGTLAILLVVVLLTGCGDSKKGDSEQPGPAKHLKLTVTTPQLTDVVKKVVGNGADVQQMVPPSISPHNLQPNTSYVESLPKQDLVIYSGGDLDEWMPTVLEAQQPKPPAMNVAKQVQTINTPSGDGVNGHWHMSIDNLIRAAEAIRDRLTQINPNAKSTYDANTARFLSRAKEVRAALDICAGSIKPKHPRIVTDHDDFDYLAREYGFRIVGRTRKSGSKPATPSEVKRAIVAGKTGRAKLIVTSFGTSDAGIVQVTQGLKLKKIQLPSDNLSPNSSQEDSALASLIMSVRGVVLSAGGNASNCTVPE